MSGRSVVSEVMDGAGLVSAVAAEIAQVEAALADPSAEARKRLRLGRDVAPAWRSKM